jgi:hypothetical protein
MRSIQQADGMVPGGVALVASGAACLVYADRANSTRLGVGLAAAGATAVVWGGSLLLHAFGLSRGVFYDPSMPPGGHPSARVEDFDNCKTLASGLGRGVAVDPSASRGKDRLTDTEGSDLRTACKAAWAPVQGAPGEALYKAPMPVRERLWRDSPAALAFDSLLVRALYARPLPDVGTEQRPECPKERPTATQLKAFMEIILGREALLPSVGVAVPLQVPCVLVRGCTTLGSDEYEDDVRALMHIEFIAVRDGDVMGVHYEAHVASNPMALTWFRRLGEMPTADAFSCTTLPRRAA